MKKTNIKIAIAETGYVGLSNEILLERHNEVLALDDVADKVYNHDLFGDD